MTRPNDLLLLFPRKSVADVTYKHNDQKLFYLRSPRITPTGFGVHGHSPELFFFPQLRYPVDCRHLKVTLSSQVQPTCLFSVMVWVLV